MDRWAWAGAGFAAPSGRALIDLPTETPGTPGDSLQAQFVPENDET